MDEKSLPKLDEMGIDEWCPQIERLALEFRRAISLSVISRASSLFPLLTQLEIMGPRDHLVSLDHEKSLCQKVTTSFPQLTTLQFTNVRLGNEKVVEIAGYLGHHECPQNIL